MRFLSAVGLVVVREGMVAHLWVPYKPTNLVAPQIAVEEEGKDLKSSQSDIAALPFTNGGASAV